MTPSRDDDVRPAEPGESEELEEEPRRSILSATWFRLLIVLVVVGAVAAVSAPYVMDSMTGWSRPIPVVTPSNPRAIEQGSPTTAATTPPASPPTSSSSPTTPPPLTSTSKSPEAPTAPAAPATPTRPSLTLERRPATTGEAVAKRDSAAPANAREVESSTERVGGERGDFWIQVAAFRNPETAKQLAARLREKHFRVDESSLAPSPRAPSVRPSSAAPDAEPPSGAATDLYRVVVTDASAGDLAAKVSARGFTLEASSEGTVIRPPLPLRDAVAISQQLAGDGFKVQVKRSGTGDAKPRSPRPAPVAAVDDTLHRVRVGAFPDRASAVVALRQLQALGYTPFIAPGRE
jgi:cell division septation protein DedD